MDDNEEFVDIEIDIDEELYKQLEEMAAVRGVTIDNFIAELLKIELQRYEDDFHKNN